MTRAIFVPMKRFASAFTVLALAACTGTDGSEAKLPDSALTQVQSDPAGAPEAVQPDSLIPGPATSTSTPTPSVPTSAAPAQRSSPPPPRRTTSDPAVRQPPPPRDTRPSIPFPPDTL